MIIRDHKENQSFVIDFRPSAPHNATPDLYSRPEQFDYVSTLRVH